MKKLLLVATALVSLVACNRNNGTDEITPEPVSPIVGTWRHVRTEIISGADGSTLQTHVSSPCESKSTVEFRTNGTYTYKDFVDVAGNCVPDGDETRTYTYDVARKTLKSTDEDGVIDVFEILLLNKTNLHWVTGLYDHDRDGVTDKEVLFYVRQN